MLIVCIVIAILFIMGIIEIIRSQREERRIVQDIMRKLQVERERADKWNLSAGRKW